MRTAYGRGEYYGWVRVGARARVVCTLLPNGYFLPPTSNLVAMALAFQPPTFYRYGSAVSTRACGVGGARSVYR